MSKRQWMIIFLGLALLGVIALCGLTFYGTYDAIRRGEAGGVDLFVDLDTKVEGDQQFSFEDANGKRLVIDTDLGNITFTEATGSTLDVAAHKTAWGLDEADAQQRLDTITIIVEETPTEIHISFQDPREEGFKFTSRPSSQVDFTVQLPSGMALDSASRFGVVSLTGLTSNATINVEFGEVRVNDLTGSLDVTNRNGKIEITRVNAEEESMDVNAEFSEITINDVNAQTFNLQNRNGAIDLTDLSLSGDGTLGNEFGRIEVENFSARNLTVNTRNADLIFLNVSVAEIFSIDQEFGSASLTQLDADTIDIFTRNAPYTFDSVRGKLDMQTEFGDLRIDHGQEMALKIVSRNGSVRYTGSLDPEAAHEISTEFGNVTLIIPGSTALDVDLQTEFGQIQSDLPLTLAAGTVSEDHWVGTINGGGISLKITTRNGNITLSRQN